LITLVPLINTKPDLSNNPWGENESTLRLMPNRLLGDLKTVFEGKHPDCRDHWHSNPSKMPDEVIRLLPRTIMVFATLDILYKSGVKLKDRLQAQGVEVDWMEANGLHQVKDIGQFTEAGHAVMQDITQKSIELVKHARCSAAGNPGV
jgi:acetyl esterase/lipase